MKKRVEILLISIIFIVTSCIGKKGTSEVNSTPLATFPNQTYTITIPIILTDTPVVQLVQDIVTPGLTLTNTPVAQPGSGVTHNCISIMPDLPSGNNYTGKIAFESLLPETDNAISFYSLDGGKFSEISGRGNGHLSMSPDRKLYAYENFERHLLEVYASDGKQIKSIVEDKPWSIVNWLDNQRLVMLLSEPIPNAILAEKYPQAVVIFNPFTNQSQTFQPDYPDIDTASRGMSWGRSGTTVYDPTLTRVVYPGGMQVGNYSGEGYILYGIPEKMELAKLPSFAWNALPIWSPDGSQFIVLSQYEFSLIDYDGKVSKISNLNPGFDPNQESVLKYLVDYYSWSPDGQHVALWLESYLTKRSTLAILDTQTEIINDTCIPAGYDPLDIRTNPYPVWSPDGKSLVVAANYHKEDTSNEVLLVDLEKQDAFKLSTNNFPAGWLALP